MPEHVRKMKASQLAHVQRLVLDLETLLGNTKRDVTETKKSIARAEKRVSIFEELSRDLQFGKYCSQYVQLSRKELRSAEKRKERLGLQVREVAALLERAMELAERSSGEGAR